MNSPSEDSNQTQLIRHLQTHPKAFIESMPLAVWLLDRSGLLIDANQAAVDLFRLKKTGQPTPWQQVLGLPPVSRLVDQIQRHLQVGEDRTFTVNSPFDHPDWSIRALQITLSFSDQETKTATLFLQPVDLDEDAARDRASEERRRNRSWFGQLMMTLPDKIYFKDRDSRFLAISLTQARQFGLRDPAEAIGKTDFDFFVKSHAETARAEEREIMESERPLIGKEEKITLTDGRELWASTTKVPLRDSENRVIGLFGISRDITDRKRAEEEVRRKNAEMQADLKMAYEIQKAFLTLEYPDFPRGALTGKATIGFGHRYLPVATLGGDFFEIVQISDTESGVLICDVMGHGVRAALVTAFLRGLMGELQTSWREPEKLVAEINRALIPVLRQSGSLMFVTLFYGVADVTRREFRYANAGHPLPFLLRRSRRQVERIHPPADGSEPAAGLVPDFTYSVAREPLSQGDLVLLFTDGLWEIENAGGVFFGEHGLREALESGLPLDSEPLLDRVMEAATRHASTPGFMDDVCLLAIDFRT